MRQKVLNQCFTHWRIHLKLVMKTMWIIWQMELQQYKTRSPQLQQPQRQHQLQEQQQQQWLRGKIRLVVSCIMLSIILLYGVTSRVLKVSWQQAHFIVYSEGLVILNIVTQFSAWKHQIVPPFLYHKMVIKNYFDNPEHLLNSSYVKSIMTDLSLIFMQLLLVSQNDYSQTFWQPWTLIKHFPGKEYYDRFECDIYAITTLYHKMVT